LKSLFKIFLLFLFISSLGKASLPAFTFPKGSTTGRPDRQAQNDKADKILNEVIQNFSKVKDYIVDIDIKVDVSFLKVPETKATLYFKEPDKIHFESENFAMLPKEGLNFSPEHLLRGNHSSFFEKDTMLDGNDVYIVKVIPLSESANVVLTTLWIDKDKFIIRRIESTTKSNGTFTINLYYNDEINYPLPSKMVFSFNIEKMNIPRGFAGDTEEESKSNDENSKIGKVYINYSDYRVNTNIPDSVFVKKEEK
jgi:hypothetical protein